MSDGQPYYLTTPIYYVNVSPHIGHVYTMVAADALARFMRLDGRRVMFLTGTDEHGQKVDKSARAAGLDTQTFCDQFSEHFRELTRLMNISNDQFIRTTEPRHIEASQAMWQVIARSKSPKGRENIYLGKCAGWYAVGDEAFYGEEELTTDAYGNKRTRSGATVEWVEEASYFFRLSDWQDWLLEYYKSNPDFIGPPPWHRKEVVRFVERGLTDLPITRTSLSWGVPVPGDSKHVMYVWLDALTNYLTAIGYPETEGEPFRTFWPADLHIVGKGMVRFHCVCWPAFLAAAGLSSQKRVFAHGWWTVKGQKSLSIAPKLLVEKYGVDGVRYFMLRQRPFGRDGDISRDALIKRNNELANFGNLTLHVLAMIQRYCHGTVPAPGAFAAVDEALLRAARDLRIKLRTEFSKQAFHRALELVWHVTSEANRYLNEQGPLAFRRNNPPRLPTVAYTLVETIRHLAILLQPATPAAASRLLDQLAQPEDRRDFAALALYPVAAGTTLPPPDRVFPRFVEAAEAG